MDRGYYLMPLYEIKCRVCGEHQDIFRKLADWDNLPDCCGEPTSRVLSAPAVFEDIKPYKSMVTGEMITSRSQHRKHLITHNVREVGNDNHTPQVDHFAIKRKKEALRKEIAEKIN
jgi:putative FmdB family regulatory protein